MAAVYRPDVIAHRGASAYVEENTLTAYDLALALGADVLELDVRATADGELVAVHDDTLLRTAGVPHRVGELTRSMLAELDARARPVTLDEILSRYGRATRYLVDLKDPVPAWERRVVDAIERHGLRDRVVVQSFDHDALRRLHEHAAWLPVAVLFPRGVAPPGDLYDIAQFAAGIGPCHVAVDDDLIVEAGAYGLAVRPWTIDAPQDVERMLELRVAGVITNRPDVARALVRRGRGTAGRALATAA